MIAYSCPKCGERLRVDDAKAGREYACPLCDNNTRVPDRIIHEARLRELRAIHAKRHLTANELAECVVHLRAIGNEAEAVKADQAAGRQRERERKAAALEAAGVAPKAKPPWPKVPKRWQLPVIVTAAIAMIVVAAVELLGPFVTLSQIGQAAKDRKSTRLKSSHLGLS